MEVHATTRNVRMSAQKMREVVRQIQGMNALQAQAVLAVVPRKSARFVARTLKSAMANAENNNSGPLTDAAIRRLFERIIDEARAAERDAMDSDGRDGKERNE